MTTRIRDIQYKLLQGLYWMLYGVATIYTTVFLLSHGISAALIGTIVAVSNIIAAPGQVLVGTLIDKYRRINWKNLLLGLGAVQLAILILLLIFRSNDLLNAILFPAFAILMFMQNPLVNTAFFYYTSRGESIDFGTARGIGSLAYALLSFIVGKCIVSYGELSVVVSGILVLLLIGALLLTMPVYHEDPASVKTSSAVQGNSGSAGEGGRSDVLGFIRRYPTFALTVLGLVLIMGYHNMIHTYLYMIVQQVGGDSSTLGNAFSIEAVAEIPIMFGFFFLIQKISSRKLMAIAGIGFLLKAAGYLIAGSILTLYLVQCLQMVGYAIFASASVYYSNDVMRPNDQGKGQGYMTAAVTIGGAIGNAVGGLVYDQGGIHSVMITGLLFALAGTVLILMGTLRKPSKKGIL